MLADEVKRLGLGVSGNGFGKVRFTADKEGLYRSLMALRTADRVLLEAARFRATDFEALFEGAKAVRWENLIPPNLGVSVDKVRSGGSALSAQTSIQAVVHKAAAERLCRANALSRLPETDDAAKIRVHIEKDEVSLMLDMSGDPLFKRGYRRKGGTAPLRETSAAAMLLLSGWKRKYPLCDPFCGSGTVLAEALMYACDAAPGLCRDFALSRLLIADASLEEKTRSHLRRQISLERKIRIQGSDADPEAAKLAGSNISALKDTALAPGNGFENEGGVQVRIEACPMEEAGPAFPKEEGDGKGEQPAGFIVTNPPYGKRLGDRAGAEKTYAAMAGIAGRFPGWKLAVICDHQGFESFFRRRADRVREISGSGGRSYLYEYDRLHR